MASFNKVILLGNLTRDPELRSTNNGTSICKFGLATTRVSRSAEGDTREEVVFIDVDCFGKQAELIAKYFVKGKSIFVEGRLRLDQWESAAGEKRSKLVAVLENFQFIGSKADDNLDNGGMERSASVTNEVSSIQVDGDDDVPF
ncbi:MAG: single-stranded DNA-binding protein [Puniceicoccales bacterium]|jgi:single-strand DNA-binding protein|nr:single-stranded DNA-binding protein [Puniceicoccales bacterium]